MYSDDELDLANNGYFNEQSFLHYLKYLLYFKKPKYIKFLTYFSFNTDILDV